MRSIWNVCGETGGAQTDVACPHSDNIDRVNRRVVFNGRKLENRSKGSVAIVIGTELKRILSNFRPRVSCSRHLQSRTTGSGTTQRQLSAGSDNSSPFIHHHNRQRQPSHCAICAAPFNNYSI
jgi:hypothetical protein